MDKKRVFFAELVGTFTLIFVGVGAIFNASLGHTDLLGVALAHGLAIGVMVTATMHVSGGHLNPAVTFGLLSAGKVKIDDAILYWIAQLIGASLAGFLCLAILGDAVVVAGTPAVSGMIHLGQAVGIEMVLTFLLVFVVFGAAVDARAPKTVAGLAIGLTITIGILFGGPLTGGAINPARAFGPALATNFWEHHWVYWIGPLLGGALAGLVYKNLVGTPEK
jgi:MIP family channel proteins